MKATVRRSLKIGDTPPLIQQPNSKKTFVRRGETMLRIFVMAAVFAFSAHKNGVRTTINDY